MAKKKDDDDNGNGNGNGNGNSGANNPKTVAALSSARALVNQMAAQRRALYNYDITPQSITKGAKTVDSGGDEIKSYNPVQTTRLRDEKDDY